MENNFNKTKITIDAFKKFAEQFNANDPYNQMVLEEFLKIILEKKQNDQTKK
jgi:hypothetical protein